ncbi:MAG: aldo/keto reductase [Caldisphaeraceae archaeon]|nr:aldo/keto reductase [Caldisphaeraceae archaeon]MEB3798508.1 aldo/keto reductase [Caldisphaeraceae archaeon]
MEVCDRKISRIGLGTYGMGGGYWVKDTSRDKSDIEALRYAYEKGITLFDTAEMYGDGHAEELLGEAFSSIDEKPFIITKVWPNHLRWEELVKSARMSKKRLKVDSIDLYLIHWPSNSVSIKDSIRGMERLIDMGIIRCMGVSNFSLPQLEEAMSSTKKYEVVANEIEYNVYNKSAERELIPFSLRNGVTIISYSPLAKGRVSSDRILTEIGRKYGKTAVQVALNYLSRVSIPIPKSSSKEHIDEILGSLGWDLDDSDYYIIKGL